MWLIKEEKAHQIAEARKLGFRATEEQTTAFAAKMEAARDGGMPRSLSIAGDVAEIRVEGVLTKDPDFWMAYFGGGNTAYRDIIAALATADADPSVKRAVLYVDSPGGNVDGLFDTLAALEGFSKPLTARASEACSAAYAIASMAKTIEATNAAACFGSVGVAATFFVDESLVTVTSTEAPEKRPDLTTEEGKASVRRTLDAIHELFVDAIASGRKTTAERVNADFGRGAVVLASEAKKRGMIDALAKPKLRAVRADTDVQPSAQDDSQPRAVVKQESPSGKQGVTQMTSLEELQAQHPALYEAALERGATKERSRVSAHIKLGEKFGAIAFSHKAILEGKSPQDDDVYAEYITAGANRSERNVRQQEADAAGAVLDGAKVQTSADEDIGDVIAARLAAKKRSA